jgi:hypothetical protein
VEQLTLRWLGRCRAEGVAPLEIVIEVCETQERGFRVCLLFLLAPGESPNGVPEPWWDEYDSYRDAEDAKLYGIQRAQNLAQQLYDVRFDVGRIHWTHFEESDAPVRLAPPAADGQRSEVSGN